MKKILLFLTLVLATCFSYAQKETTKWAVGFPITDYILGDSDSIKIVQVALPDGWSIPDKEVGLLKGIYRDGIKDTAEVGWGRCQLVKGDYYYFGIHCTNTARQPKKGDLLFVMMDKPTVSEGKLPALAALGISLQDVYASPFYDRWKVMLYWDQQNETALLDSLVADISFTAKAMREQAPDMDRKVGKGPYKDKLLFEVMENATKEDVYHFIDYIIARPQHYMGNEWKISEIFATWVDEGAPTLVRE